jgi:hypothetical protein
MFLGLVLAAGLLLSFCLGSLWLNATDVAIINSLQMFSDMSIFGLFHVPIPNLNFFLVGMKALTTFNFAFFTGPMQLLQFIIIIVVVSGIMWGFFSTIIYLGMGLLNKL